jgi:hypothetical protein
MSGHKTAAADLVDWGVWDANFRKFNGNRVLRKGLTA